MTRATVRTCWGARPIAAALSLSMLFAGPGSAAVVDDQAKQPIEAPAEVDAIEIEADLSAPQAPVAPALRAPMSAECEELAVSAVAAPEWYAERCGGAVPEFLAPPVDTSFVPGDTVVFCALFSATPALARRLLTAPLPTSTYTNVGPCSVAPASIFAMDYDNAATTLWAIDSQCAASCTGTAFGTIDAATGAFTPVGNITGSPAGSNFAGMKFDPTDGTVYIVTISGGTSQLRRLNLATGVSTQIGGNIAGLIIDIGISNSGVIYGHDISLDRIVTIDKTTGVATPLGPTGIDANFAQGMDFDASTNTLYLFAITVPGNVGRIGSVNLATGAFTQLSQNGEELEGAIRVATTPPVAPDIFIDEVEPNDTSANAQILPSNPARVRGYLYRAPFVAGNVDVDVFSFTAPAGARVSAAVMTGWSSGSQDSELDILDVDGTTVLEMDDDNGTIGATASNIAGRTLAAAGTYYVRVRQGLITSISGTIRPYDLYVDVQSGTPAPEVEPNENSGQATPLPASGWASGVVSPAADADVFSLNVNAGDTIIATLDVDPERDAVFANLRLGIGNFNNFILVTGDTPPAGDVPSEALMMTAKNTGPHFVYVLEQLAGVGSPTATYNVSVRVIPARTRTCTTYTGTGGPIADLGTTDFTLAVPDAGRIGYVRATVTATHPATADLDVTLIGPGGNEVLLFDDPATTVGAPAPQINATLEDEAAIPMAIFGVHSGVHYIPESGGRLEFFNNMERQGTWTLRVRDDLTANAGTLDSWSIDVCQPAPRPACVTPGPAETTIFSTDFEAGDAGFTHSGTLDEWERGLPSFNPITTAHSGVNAWKTDLDNLYENSSNQNLLSPNFDLTAASGRITLNWWQKYNIESATFDRYWVEVQQVGQPATARRVFEWRGATMRRSLGNPSVPVEQAAGWAPVQADISGFAGSMVEVIFHLETDTSVQLTGVGIDDVLVTSCAQVQGQTIADAAITKTDGQTTYFPGQVLTYTIVASNLGPAAIVGANVTDDFPVELTGVSWTCVASAGSSCGGASGTGDINAIVNLLNGGTATFTATATVSATATGPITNIARITVPATTADPVLANNTATDTNTFQALTVEPAALAVDTAGNSVYEPNETVVVAPSWRNTSAGAVALAGALANHTGPAGPTYTIPDGAASYGTIAAGATASCATGGNCYSVANTAAARPATHWDSTAVETVTPTGTSKTWTLHIGASFTDVALSSTFYRFIETILHNNVTGGCTPTTYCPAASTTREQMAVFVLVSKEGTGYSPVACVAGAEAFADVPASSPFCRWIEELARRGVVAGCGGGNYCPGSATTREQMAVFVLRTLDPALNPPPCATPSMFADVPASSPFCRWIEELVRRQVVTGCGGGNYCPAADVTREQMSVFLSVTFGLVLYGL